MKTKGNMFDVLSSFNISEYCNSVCLGGVKIPGVRDESSWDIDVHLPIL